MAQLRNSLATGDIAAVQPTALASTSTSYKVRNGDTLSGIAKRLNVSVKTLQQANNLRGVNIKPGQTLSLGGGESAARLADNGNSITYKVRKGDSLASIAKRHGVNTKDLLRWNSGGSANIQPGDRLTIFGTNNAPPDS